MMTDAEIAEREEVLAAYAALMQEEEERCWAEEERAAELEEQWELECDPYAMYGVSRDMF